VEATQHTVNHPTTLFIAVSIRQFNGFIERHRSWCSHGLKVDNRQTKDVAIDAR
jgi:hypothetical protein